MGAGRVTRLHRAPRYERHTTPPNVTKPPARGRLVWQSRAASAPAPRASATIQNLDTRGELQSSPPCTPTPSRLLWDHRRREPSRAHCRRIPSEVPVQSIHTRLWLCGLAWLTAVPGAPAAEPIRPEQLAKVQALIKPDRGEDAWATIPWLTDLWQARQVAARQGKPILLWEMDGHPLG